MDEAWALEQLDAFISMTALRQASAPPGVALMGDFGVPRGSGDAIAETAYVVEQIILRVLPGWTRPPDRVKDRWQTLRGEAIRARAQIMRAQELAEKRETPHRSSAPGNCTPACGRQPSRCGRPRITGKRSTQWGER